MLSESEKQEVYDIDRQIQELQNKKLKFKGAMIIIGKNKK